LTCGVSALPFEICDFDEIILTSGDGEKFKLYINPGHSGDVDTVPFHLGCDFGNNKDEY
jgi:hypothetical protein